MYYGRCARDHIVVGFTTTYAINTYHKYSSDFESRLCRSVPNISSGFLHQYNWPLPCHNCNIVECGVKPMHASPLTLWVRFPPENRKLKNTFLYFICSRYTIYGFWLPLFVIFNIFSYKSNKTQVKSYNHMKTHLSINLQHPHGN
jgi:hypothetical protein